MNIDPAWQQVHAKQRWGVWPNEHAVRWTLKTFGSVPDRAKVKFLDLGCGAGSSALFLAQEGFDVLAVDGSEDAIRNLKAERHRRSINGRGLATMVSDLTSFDMPLGFDCAIDICTLQHLPESDARQVIARAKTWLRSKGWFFSIMAAPGWGNGGAPTSPEPPRTIDRKWLARAFDGYKIDIGHEDITRPGGVRIAHWIVQAQKAN